MENTTLSPTAVELCSEVGQKLCRRPLARVPASATPQSILRVFLPPPSSPPAIRFVVRFGPPPTTDAVAMAPPLFDGFFAARQFSIRSTTVSSLQLSNDKVPV